MRSVFIIGKQGALTRAVTPVVLSLGIAMAFPAAALNLNIGGESGVSVGIGGSGGGLGVGVNLGGEQGVSAGVTAGGGSVAGVDASVGGPEGLNASVGIGDGSLLEADVSVGGGGTPSPGPGPGPGPGPSPGPGPGPGDVIDGVATQAVSPAQLAAAKRVRCRRDGNSTSYNGFVAFDPEGVGLGVVQDAQVSANLTLERLRISTIPRDGLPSTCVLIIAPQARIGNGAMIVQASWAQVSGSIPR